MAHHVVMRTSPRRSEVPRGLYSAAARQTISIANAASAMMIVATHPSASVMGCTVNRPIWWRRLPTHIMAAITGTATKPLITALQNSALMGSSGEKSMPIPSSVAAAMTL